MCANIDELSNLNIVVALKGATREKSLPFLNLLKPFQPSLFLKLNFVGLVLLNQLQAIQQYVSHNNDDRYWNGVDVCRDRRVSGASS